MRTVAFLFLCTLVLAGCGPRYRAAGPSASVVITNDDRPGPPPHAPAHGYRHKHGDGAHLRYDSGLGLYVVLGHRDHYFSDGLYFRYSGGQWELSASLSGGWKLASESKLPKSLRHQKHAKGKKK